MTKDGYTQRASELTALIEALVDDILVDLAETENARQALADRERRADELAHADLVACREQLRQESERADREAAEASSLRDEVDRLTRQRDGWHHFFEAQKQREKELCAEVDRLSRDLDPADPGDLLTVADFLDRYTDLARSEHPGERARWSAADLRCKAEYLEGQRESEALIEKTAVSDDITDRAQELLDGIGPSEWFDAPIVWPRTVHQLLAEVKRLTPREITTVEELGSLPEGSIVLDSDSPPCPWELSESGWYAAGDGQPRRRTAIALPARVLWTSEEAGR